MDQLKIGEYISRKRKEKSLTQEALAEKLGITDRAISKWENGESMPDASNIPLLCKILGISINDLFSGDDVDMKKFEEQAEKNMLSLKEREEQINKRLIFAVYVFAFISTIFFIGFVCVLSYFMEDSTLFILLLILSFIIYLIAMFFALKLETDAGYHECKNCHNRFKPTFKAVFFAPHMGMTRHLKCPKCLKKTWCKKVLSK